MCGTCSHCGSCAAFQWLLASPLSITWNHDQKDQRKPVIPSTARVAVYCMMLLPGHKTLQLLPIVPKRVAVAEGRHSFAAMMKQR